MALEATRSSSKQLERAHEMFRELNVRTSSIKKVPRSEMGVCRSLDPPEPNSMTTTVMDKPFALNVCRCPGEYLEFVRQR